MSSFRTRNSLEQTVHANPRIFDLKRRAGFSTSFSLYAKRRHLTLATFRNIVISNTLLIDCTRPCMVSFSYTQLQTSFCPMSGQAWCPDVSWWPWLSFRPCSGGHSGLLHLGVSFVGRHHEAAIPKRSSKGFQTCRCVMFFDQ